jgi:putative peptidoglycan lipid II flippase
VSLFGMAISAAELPEMASGLGDADARAQHVVKRLESSLRRVVFLVTPSAVAFAAIGGSIVALLFQTGRFDQRDSELVWIILAGSALGLLPNTIGRLLASAFYALGDTRRPMYAALVRITIGTGLGYVIALPLREELGYSVTVGAFGLTAAAGLASWVEFALLARWLTRRVGTRLPIPYGLAAAAFAIAAIAGAAGYGTGYLAAWLGLPGWFAALSAVGVFGGVYLGAMAAAKVPEARGFVRRVLRR